MNLLLKYPLQMAPPAVSWNIAPSMGQPYKCREGELIPIPRYCLRVTQHLGTCHVGEVITNSLFVNCIQTNNNRFSKF